MIWQASLNQIQTNNGSAYDLAPDSEGGAFVTGYMFNTNFVPISATLKFNAAGQEEWFQPGVGGSAIRRGQSGHLFVTGDFGTSKLSPAGEVVWTTSVSGMLLELDAEENVYVVGEDSIVTKLVSRRVLVPQISNFRIVSGTGGAFNLTVETNANYTLEGSSDLKNWTGIWTYSSDAPTNGVMQIEFTDPDLALSSQRFYRILRRP